MQQQQLLLLRLLDNAKVFPPLIGVVVQALINVK